MKEFQLNTVQSTPISLGKPERFIEKSYTRRFQLKNQKLNGLYHFKDYKKNVFTDSRNAEINVIIEKVIQHFF